MSPETVVEAMTDCFPSTVDDLSFSFDASVHVMSKLQPKPDVVLDNGLVEICVFVGE